MSQCKDCGTSDRRLFGLFDGPRCFDCLKVAQLPREAQRAREYILSMSILHPETWGQ